METLKLGYPFDQQGNGFLFPNLLLNKTLLTLVVTFRYECL